MHVIGYGRAVAWELPILGTDFMLWRIVILLPIRSGRCARALRLCADVSEGRSSFVNISALVIDITLWGSVAGAGLMAWQRGRVVLVSSMREGSMDFINIVPRIALA